MTKRNKVYTREFKQEALELLRHGDRSQQAVEHELGIGKGNLSRWLKEAEQAGEQAFPGKGHQTPEAERIRKLERENQVLRQERDLLKKVLGIISKDER